MSDYNKLKQGESVRYTERNYALALFIAIQQGKRVIDSGIFDYRTLRIE